MLFARFIHPFVRADNSFLSNLCLSPFHTPQVLDSSQENSAGECAQSRNKNEVCSFFASIRECACRANPCCVERPRGCSYKVTQAHKKHATLMTFFSRRLLDNSLESSLYGKANMSVTRYSPSFFSLSTTRSQEPHN